MEDIDSAPPSAAPEAEPAWKDGRRHVDHPVATKRTWLHKAFRGPRENDLGDGWNKVCAKVDDGHVAKFDVNVASLLLCLSSASYLKDQLSNDYRRWFTRGVETADAVADTKKYAGPYADYYVVQNGIILVFKGTDNKQEVIDDLKLLYHKDGDPCKGGKCKQTCYRHTDSKAFGCGDHCVKGCDQHAEYLRGNTHMGFYNLLFKTTNHPHKREGCKNRSHYTEGPACAFKSIMETVLAVADFISQFGGSEPMNLWITGHSLGGALASLCMARLQTIVEKEDPIVRGLSDDEKKLFVGHTVLDVMTTQLLKTVYNDEFEIRYCRQCRHCARADDDGELQTGCLLYCRRCRILKMREARGIPNCCLEGWQKEQSEDDREIIQVLSGCKKCRAKKGTPLPDSLCENCLTSCRQCGKCEPCKKENRGRYLNRGIETKRIVVLRDCYTFASPKVGNKRFAQRFERNRIEWARSSSKKPVKPVESQCWRVAVDGDLVTKQPPAFTGYAHVGELCPAPTPTTRFQKMRWLFQKAVAIMTSPLEWLGGAHFAATYYDSLSLLRAREVKKA